MSEDPRDASVEHLLRQTLRSRADVEAGDCPDAEAWAAWADDGLPAAERARLDAHLADCARCQMQMAAFVRTAPHAPAAPERPASAWSGRWRWLVPAAAGATALAIWMAVPPRTPTPPDAPAPTPMAATPAAPAPPAADRERPEASVLARREQAAAPPPVTSDARADRPAAAPEQNAGNRAGDAAAQRPAERQGFSSPTAVAPAAKARQASDAPTALAETVPAEGMGPVEIRSPDPRFRWRLLGRTIERSVDAGASWQAQATGADADLTAGASPSPLVAWVAGRAGVVLRSIDGATWTRIAFPHAVDLTDVRAADAVTATVGAADGRRWTTTDGGITWLPAPAGALQGNPAAPF